MHYTKKTLSNGVRIILVPLHEMQTATVMILAETGSEYEEKEKNGISHFLEHMCFKGTSKRPSSQIINNELDSMGAVSNAFTSSNYTGFYAKAHAEKTEAMLDIISDIYLNSVFSKEEIEKEKGVVIEEINMYEDRPQSKVWEILNEAVFGDQPAGRIILGTKHTVNSFTQEDIVSYHDTHYVPDATVVVISGKIDEEKVISQIENIFGSIKKKSKSVREKVKDEEHEPRVVIQYKESDQTHIVLNFQSFIHRYDDNRTYPAGLMGSIFGKGMGSRLFHRIRDELGLAYYIHAGHTSDIDYGQFTISLGVSNTNIIKALTAIFEELKKIKSELVLEDELRRVKDLRKGHFYLSLETSDDWGHYYGFQELYHENIMTPEQVIEKREKVTAQEIQKIAQEIFRPEVLTIAMIGPVKDEKAIYDSISL